MIPLTLYTPIFYNALLAIVLATTLYFYMAKIDQGEMTPLSGATLPLVGITILYMGLRPISGYFFGDMATYSREFEWVQRFGTKDASWQGEWIFSIYMLITSQILDADGWFLLNAALYVGLAALAFRLTHKRNAYLAVLMCVSSFSFWSYGTNGIRAGLASSLVLLGIACYQSKWRIAILFFLALGTHKSMGLPIAAFLCTSLIKNPRSYLIGYGLAIVLSAVMGGWWESFFANSGLISDERFKSYLLAEASEGVFSKLGFRWDFILYSICPIIMGAHYIYKRNFTDELYRKIFCTYVAVNAFWVLVIRAEFSNRFAYLSWFLMSWVIIYPPLKQRIYINQKQAVATILLVYFSFTYSMFLIK